MVICLTPAEWQRKWWHAARESHQSLHLYTIQMQIDHNSALFHLHLISMIDCICRTLHAIIIYMTSLECSQQHVQNVHNETAPLVNPQRYFLKWWFKKVVQEMNWEKYRTYRWWSYIQTLLPLIPSNQCSSRSFCKGVPLNLNFEAPRRSFRKNVCRLWWAITNHGH